MLEQLNKTQKVVLALIVICVIGGATVATATVTPKVWVQYGHWQGESRGAIMIGPLNFKNATTYHITMTFTPHRIAEDQPNRTIFYMATPNDLITPEYDWSKELAQDTKRVVKEYTFSTQSDPLMKAQIVIKPYYGDYDILIEYIALIFDTGAETGT